MTVGTSVTGLFHVIPNFFKVVKCQKCQKIEHGARQLKDPQMRALRITQMIVTDGTILSARIAGAAYRGCPVAMRFDKQTKQRNSLLKENYEKQLKEHNTNKQ